MHKNHLSEVAAALFLVTLATATACKRADPEVGAICDRDEGALGAQSPHGPNCRAKLSALKKAKPGEFLCLKKCSPVDGASQMLECENNCLTPSKTTTTSGVSESKRMQIMSDCNINECRPKHEMFVDDGKGGKKMNSSYTDCMASCCRDHGMQVDCKQ